MRNTLRALSAILFLTAASGVSSEQTRADSVAVPAIAAQPADVATIDGVMKAFYEVISGPAGQPRQWSRDRTLYIPEIRFVSMDVDSKGKPVPRIVTHQQFVDASNPSMVAKGFDEREIHRVTKRFGNIAHVFSTYETRQTPGGPLTGRGINSIELFWDGDRWWIASAIWDDERPDNPIPKEYLP
jgi:hypothetical protein